MVTLTLDFHSLEAIETESNRVRAFLVKIENELEPGLQRIFLEHAHIVKNTAKSIVRVDTGTLKKSIRVEHVVSWGKEKHIAVRSGGYFVNPKTGRLCDYAGYVEQRYPYMRPAYEQDRPYLEADVCMFTARLVEA